MENKSIRDRAVSFAESVIMRATDWQEVQHALGDHDEFGPWLDREYGDDAISAAQSIINDAENRLGDKMPAAYG